jgi:hypothetical protein
MRYSDKETMSNQPFETIRQQLTGYAEMSLELFELLQAEIGIAHDERRPPIADGLQCDRQRACQ